MRLSAAPAAGSVEGSPSTQPFHHVRSATACLNELAVTQLNHCYGEQSEPPE